ncbi:hypothetical protein BVI1335_1520024 [Burkholderia vietnamiensis]|nr:hypothetical protein BVI1335_1520024 [Burkholderia vietnamiensis]
MGGRPCFGQCLDAYKPLSHESDLIDSWCLQHGEPARHYSNKAMPKPTLRRVFNGNAN